MGQQRLTEPQQRPRCQIQLQLARPTQGRRPQPERWRLTELWRALQTLR